MPNQTLTDWTKPEIDSACSTSHGRFDRELALHYSQYFEKHSELRGTHRHCAKNIQAALPQNWGHLADKLPVAERHRHHLSGKSSQLIALGLLGAAHQIDPSMQWMWKLLDIQKEAGARPKVSFEFKVERTLLNEQPRVTAVDFLVDDPEIVIAAEAKWAEKGMGACSCSDGDGDATIGACADRILEREGYWSTAHEILGLPKRTAGNYCPISTSYQAVRNIAAARALAKERKSAFLLIYNEKNPYFRDLNGWIGWPEILQSTLRVSEKFLFRAVSWQRLVTLLPIDDDVKVWAREKHQIPI